MRHKERENKKRNCEMETRREKDETTECGKDCQLLGINNHAGQTRCAPSLFLDEQKSVFLFFYLFLPLKIIPSSSSCPLLHLSCIFSPAIQISMPVGKGKGKEKKTGVWNKCLFSIKSLVTWLVEGDRWHKSFNVLFFSSPLFFLSFVDRF